MLKIFNSFNHKKEIFQPICKKYVHIYVCGVTLSNYCHIGHGRTFCFFDILIRYLNYLGYKCKYVRNITDVYDNNINNFNTQYQDFHVNNKLFDLMFSSMCDNFKLLNIKKPNFEPRVTEHIDLIISTILLLIKHKHAYIAHNGDVCFKIKRSYSSYFLKNRKVKIKDSFVLWKLNKKFNTVGWSSPWGFGRPGWHISCVVMSSKYLFHKIDIHGGGSDLIFPHHENEFLLFKNLFNNNVVNYWIHTGMVLNDNEKMSKSKNNFFLLRNLLKKYHPDVIKYFLMSTHYRKNLFFKEESLLHASSVITKLYLILEDFNLQLHLSEKDLINFKDFDIDFRNFMNNDLNVPRVFCLFFDMVKEIKILKEKNFLLANKLVIKMLSLAKVLGFLNKNKKNYINTKNNYFIKIYHLLNLREMARKNGNWKEADLIRTKLLKLNVRVKDFKNKTTWYFKY